MKISEEFSQTTQELWSLFNTYRHLGIPADDIHLAPDAILHGERGYAGLAVIQGENQFVASVPRDLTPEETEVEWVRMAEMLGQLDLDDLHAVWLTSWARTHAVDLLSAMMDKGINVGRNVGRA